MITHFQMKRLILKPKVRRGPNRQVQGAIGAMTTAASKSVAEIFAESETRPQLRSLQQKPYTRIGKDIAQSMRNPAGNNTAVGHPLVEVGLKPGTQRRK